MTPRRLRIEVWALALAGIAGCNAPRPQPSVNDSDPSVKIPAMKIAVDQADISVEPQLIKDLESDDPAVRMYAIGALHKLTGQTLGYSYYATADQRMEAVQRWQQWLKDPATPASTQTASTQAASTPPETGPAASQPAASLPAAPRPATTPSGSTQPATGPAAR